MTATVLQVMSGIEDRLSTIAGLRPRDIQPDSVNLPAAYVGLPASINYTPGIAVGTVGFDLRITVLVSGAGDRFGQRALAGYAAPEGDGSVPGAVATDPTLGGVVEDCLVQSFRSLGLVDVGGVQAFGGEFTVFARA